jgi:CDP-glucose 4,6-dehydratase
LSGYLTIAAKLLGDDAHNYCSSWNIGPLPGNELPVYKVVEHFIACWGSGEYVDASDHTQPPEANVLRLCIDKAIWKLGWRPCWNVYESLEKVADWYRAYSADPTNIRAFSVAQIKEYECRLAEASK